MPARLSEASARPIYYIDLQEGRYWGECPMCNRVRRLDHAVAYYCGPTHDEIGSVTTEYADGGIVGGMPVCKDCHDAHYPPAGRRALQEDGDG
jgi:hypothetical protein